MPSETSYFDISIIIVNYKSWQHLTNCLNSLNFDSGQFTFEVIVVDNCSEDGQLEIFQSEFSNVKFIKNSGNNGFAHANNLGVSESRGKFLLFLNPDTVANEKAILEMWKFAINNPTVGIVSCLQKRTDGTYEKSQRQFLTLLTLFGLFRSIQNKAFAQKVSTFANGFFTDWVSGSLVFISKKWFESIEGWNEDYWMYFEDMDLSKRVHLANGKVAVLNNVEILHSHGGASRINLKTTSLTKTEVQISKHVYIDNHFKNFERIFAHFLLVITNILNRSLMAILGILLFFIPKARLNVYLFVKIFNYYLSSLYRLNWLSKNSVKA